MQSLRPPQKSLLCAKPSEVSGLSSAYQDHYLENYWPEHPNNPDMWQDNLELLHAYFSAAEEISAREKRKLETVDISTGPGLAPLLATMSCIESVRLSDFEASNRDRIRNSPIGYWKEYATELVRLFPDHKLRVDQLLEELDHLRGQFAPLDVDLRRSPVFLPDLVQAGSVELLTMHFVVDSICETSGECFELLAKAQSFVRDGGWLLLSALIDSNGWQLGDVKEPSPNLSEAEIDDFLTARGFNVISKFRSIRKAKQIYDGGWTVFLAQKQGHGTSGQS